MRRLLLAFVALLAASASAQPVIDGVIAPTEGYTLLGTSAGGPSPSFGVGHEINALYTRVNATAGTLTLGIAGNVQNGNRILVFIDSKQGGYTSGNFGRAGAPAGLVNINSGITFDPGFSADYALVIGTNGDQSNYFVDLYTLSGTAGNGGGPNVFLGDRNAPNVGADPASASTARGFEVVLTYSGVAGANLLVDRTSVQLFAAYTGDSGFLSNQFISPAGPFDGNYGDGSVSFGAATPDPLAFVWQQTAFNPSAAQNDGAGWRHLASPVLALDVDDLAQINLVQGVPGGVNPEQYPGFADNVYTRYDPTDPATLPSGFVPPATTDDVLAPGTGFFWYWYDNDFDPVANGNTTGTSRSVELTPFVLRAGGKTPRQNVTASFADYPTAQPSRFFLVGNPFALPLAASGITSVPARQAVLQVYDPATSSYTVCVEAGGAAPCNRSHLDVWQGAIAEVASVAPTEVGGTQFTYAFNSTTDDPAADPGFVGRGGAQPIVRFTLTGATAGGATTDVAAIVRFDPAASDGWDVLDASKLMPLASVYSLLAPVLERDGAPWRVAVNTLVRDRTASIDVPMAFTATHAGSFVISWEGVASLPEGWRAELHDVVTGARQVLADGDTYPFTADATGWTDRFTLAIGPAQIVAGEGAPTRALALAPVRPNPAHGAAQARLTTGEATWVRATVVDALGRTVQTLHDAGVAPDAALDLAVDVRRMAPGAYVLRVEAGGEVLVQPLTVIR